MVSVNGYTAEKMLEIENETIVDGNVVVNDLILIRRDGIEINAGNVRGPIGPAGPPGGLGEAPSDGTTYGRKDGAWQAVPIDRAYGILGIVKAVISQGSITTVTDLTDCSVTVTIAAGRTIRITGQGGVYGTVSDDQFLGKIKEGDTDLGYWFNASLPVSGRDVLQHGCCIINPSAGPHTYKLTLERTAGTGTGNIVSTSVDPILLLVEDIGPAI